jgi:hypothetical protein
VARKSGRIIIPLNGNFLGKNVIKILSIHVLPRISETI